MTRRELLSLAFFLTACKRESPQGTAPLTKEFPPLLLREDTPNLLLTYIDDRGNFRTTQNLRDIPEAFQDPVRVILTSQDEGTSTDLLYAANLGEKNPDGTYRVRTMTRAEWEAAATRRRTPSSASSTTAVPPSLPQGKVIVYGASWCKPCHEAQGFLQSQGVPFIYHDIEEEEEARKEMNRKLERAALRKGTIPVLDVKGRILVGYSPSSLRSALKEAFGNRAAL